MKKYLLLLVLITAMGKLVNAQISYVTPAGGGLKNGTDWNNAYDNTQLQKAIDEAAASGFPEVWVAAGTYKAGDLITSYFFMRNNVAIYGGFAGHEISRDARNWQTNVTILSGEHGNPLLKTDNSKYVIYNDGVASTAILDGFTIRDGFNGIGQGDAGGAISNHDSAPMLNNCTFTENTGSFGGAIYNSNSYPMLTNCIITNNSARRGGAMCNNNSNPILINCKITGNTASINGGALFNEGASSIISLINCTIADNTAGTVGGAVCNEAASTTIYNSIIWGNESTIAGSEFYIESGTINLDYSCYQSGTNTVDKNPDLGGLFTANHSTVLDPRFVSAPGNDFLIAGNSPCIDAGIDSYNTLEFDLRGAGHPRKLNKSDGTPGTIDMGAYEYKFGEDPVGGTTYTWTGTTDTNWNFPGNWSTALVPTSADGALLPAGAPNYPLITERVDCYDLTIDRSASLTIATTGSMTVTGTVTINNGRLMILSDATGTGSLIAGNAISTPTVTAQRYLPANAWTMVSSPLNGQTIASFITTPMNNFNLQTVGTSRGITDYDPATNNWNSLFTNSTTGNLISGKGFAMHLQGSSDATVLFTGMLEAGPLSVVTELGKWTCVGNPYTSAIGITSSANSADNFLTRNASHLDPVYGVYILDRSNGGNQLTGSYTAISNVPSPTDPAGFEFQQGQAFMVKMKPTVNDVSFNKAMQVHLPALALKSAKSAQADWAIIKLSALVNNQKSSAIIGFSDGMTNGLDPTYDAGLYKGASELSISTSPMNGDTIPYAIQALPSNQYEYVIIPIGLHSKVGGEVVFSAQVFNLQSPGRAILEDLQTKTFTDLAIDTYTTTIEPNTKVLDRFRLHASHVTVTAVNNKPLAGRLSAYSTSNTEIKITGSVSKLAIATLYDIQGKVVLVKNLEEGSLNSIRTPNLQPGIYLLSVKDNQQVQRFKIPFSQ
ncbi:MAG TPA: T9SS type A sorting domain-containing protein [Prolixibacteraceae bacterium]|jgi:hypothetical protein